MHRIAIAIGSALAVSTSALAGGLVAPYTETFDADSANWTNFNSSGNLDWFSNGGPADSAYASGTYNLENASGMFPPVVLRAQQDANASGGAFVGNWIESGVIGFSFDIRHDLDQPVTIFGRFATPQNNPGASANSSITVEPNTWTTVTFDLTPDSADIISFGSGDYESVFSNIGNIQLGFYVPDGLAGQDIPVRVDIDNAGLVIPTPGSAALLGVAGLALVRRRR
ncbi:MAG: hypothetical protein ACIAQF_12050 [Phycisphaerales bacterium JB065]